jgi:hypothetical protein
MSLEILAIIFFFWKKKDQLSNFIKILAVGAELFNADGRDETNSRFWQFCDIAPKI